MYDRSMPLPETFFFVAPDLHDAVAGWCAEGALLQLQPTLQARLAEKACERHSLLLAL